MLLQPAHNEDLVNLEANHLHEDRLIHLAVVRVVKVQQLFTESYLVIGAECNSFADQEGKDLLGHLSH